MMVSTKGRYALRVMIELARSPREEYRPLKEMAKEQNLSLNPTKISGTCGRLMCCLKYEQEAYEDLLRSTPRVGSQVLTPDGNGVVTEVSLLTGMLKVQLDRDEDLAPVVYQKEDVKWGRDLAGRGRRGREPKEGDAPREDKNAKEERGRKKND